MCDLKVLRFLKSNLFKVIGCFLVLICLLAINMRVNPLIPVIAEASSSSPRFDLKQQKGKALAESLPTCQPVPPGLALSESLPTCPPVPPGLEGRMKNISDSISLKEAERNFLETVALGGSYKPRNCAARWKVAILVCFRDRDEHLGPFHNHMHRLLQRQQLDYTFYIINQTDSMPFNRGKLFNVGFVESKKDGNFDCYIFHDVDFLPEDDRHLYHCSDMPRHMTVFYNNHPYINNKDFLRYFGGVVMFRGDHLEMMNGWSNSFWGWGGEDDDMKLRVGKQNLVIWSYPKDIGHYKMLKHKAAPKNPKRYKILKKSAEKMAIDGINSLKYKLISKIKHPLFTSLNVDISEDIK